jgi:hypothetical protein
VPDARKRRSNQSLACFVGCVVFRTGHQGHGQREIQWTWKTKHLSRLKLALRYIEEPLAVSLLQEVIADIEERLNQVAAARSQRPSDVAQPVAQQQQQPQDTDEKE